MPEVDAKGRRREHTAGVALLILALSGCGHSAAARPDKVAVLSLDNVGLPPAEILRMRQRIGHQIASLAEVPVAEEGRVDAAKGAAAECQEGARDTSIACSTAIGQAVGASHVVAGAVGGLGKTYVLQLKLIKVKDAVVTRALEETLLGDPGVLERSLARVTTRLLDLPQRRPWYTRWWVWTLATTAIATAVVVPLALQDDDPYSDVPLP